jgi:hypothetical protein
MKSLVAVAGLSLAIFLVPPIQAAAAPAGAAAPTSSCARPPRSAFTYHWPIKPFNVQHPVRGVLGDPRILNPDQPFGWTGPDQIGAHSFHNGIDIFAESGTPAYPVVSGRITVAKADVIVVKTSDGRAFQYYHLSRGVHLGQHVRADRTVLGWVRAKFGHVHFAEIDGHFVHNPLDPGHLEPYRDWGKPVATGLYVDDGPLPSLIAGRVVTGNDQLAVAAFDPPAMVMPGGGPWSGLPQVPALVEWRLFHGRTHTGWKVAVDFRKTEPLPKDFWDVYGPGTYQNSPVFDHKLYLGTAGRYLFRVHLHPSRLSHGTYHLAVRVSDLCQQRSTATWTLQIGA